MPVAKDYRDSPFYRGTQGDKQFAVDAKRRDEPWTETDYELVERAARALVRTRRSVDLPGKVTLTAFDGRALWTLLGALDRTHRRD